MKGPATKRPRRIQRQDRAAKRKLTQDTEASLPEKKRSRKGADLKPKELLDSGCAIGDGQVLQVLRLWKY